jgi:hypothetical protein
MLLCELFADDLLFCNELANEIGAHWSTVALNMNVAPTVITSRLHPSTSLEQEFALAFLRHLADERRSVNELTQALTSSGLPKIAIGLADTETRAQIPPYASGSPLPHCGWMERARGRRILLRQVGGLPSNRWNEGQGRANGDERRDLATEIAPR